MRPPDPIEAPGRFLQDARSLRLSDGYVVVAGAGWERWSRPCAGVVLRTSLVAGVADLDRGAFDDGAGRIGHDAYQGCSGSLRGNPAKGSAHKQAER